MQVAATQVAATLGSQCPKASNASITRRSQLANSKGRRKVTSVSVR